MAERWKPQRWLVYVYAVFAPVWILKAVFLDTRRFTIVIDVLLAVAWAAQAILGIRADRRSKKESQ